MKFTIACILTLTASVWLTSTFVPSARGAEYDLTTLYSWPNNGFSLGSPNNGYPQGPLVLGGDGNIYGATAHGGDNLGIAGTLFGYAPDGTFTVLTVLTGVGSGASRVPQGSLIQAVDGSFYGTTANISTIYRTTTQGDTTFHHDFGGDDGGDPHGALVQAKDRSFYGTTSYGGKNSGKGTIYSLSLTDAFVVLHTFQDTTLDPKQDTDGATPLAGLIQATDDLLYGTTSAGGTGSKGTIFEVGTDGSYAVLYNFDGADGSDPEAALVQASDGYLYGTTVQGGDYDAGTIFRIAPDGGSFKTIYHFKGSEDGAGPHSALIQAKDGNLYGCARFLGGPNGNGTIFSVTLGGVLTVLYTFTGGSDGVEPDSLVQAADGSFYGTTLSAGVNSSNAGTIFRLTPASMLPHPPFFSGESALANDVYYLSFASGNYFGYYSYLSDSHYIYHFDLGYEYVFNAADGEGGVYLYDFASDTFFYTSSTFPFPYLYDFTLKTVLYYYPDPDPKNAGHYNTGGVRYFYDFATDKTITK